MIDLYFIIFQFKEPMILLLLASGIVSVIMGQLDDAISITVVRNMFTVYGIYIYIYIEI